MRIKGELVNSHTQMVITSSASAQYIQQFTQVDSTLFWKFVLSTIIFFSLFRLSVIFISYAKICTQGNSRKCLFFKKCQIKVTLFCRPKHFSTLIRPGFLIVDIFLGAGSGWINLTLPPSSHTLHISRRIQLLNNAIKVCWKWRNANIICYKMTSLVSL